MDHYTVLGCGHNILTWAYATSTFESDFSSIYAIIQKEEARDSIVFLVQVCKGMP